MERANTFWRVNGKYKDVREFHFSSASMSFTAYYKDEDLIFVLDDTCDIIAPNDLLIIEPLETETNLKNPNVKWDSILKEKFSINPMEIRPKENTKYKKLDISYTSLDLYRSFITLQNEETLDLIEQNREILSLENAYERESENLLVYNKSGTTLEKAKVTLEKLQKRILNISKKMKKQEEEEEKNPENINQELKNELMEKLYTATEKLKRTERRIKRANKRYDSAQTQLTLNRQQIAEIKRRIEERKLKDKEVEKEKNIDYKPLQSENFPSVNNKEMMEFKAPEIETLTIENNNATNRDEEVKEQTFLTKESTTMAKETENKTIQPTQEFKPPYVDDTAISKTDNKNDSNIRFAKKSPILDDKYKKIWMYSLSIIVSLIVVFGLFYFVSGDSSTDEYTVNYIEQNYEPVNEEVIVEESAPMPEEMPMEESMSVYEEPAPMPEETMPIITEPVKEEPIVVPAKKTEPTKKPVIAPVKKTTAKKEVAKPVVKEETPVEEEVVVEEEPVEEIVIDENYYAPEEDIYATEEDMYSEPEVYEEDVVYEDAEGEIYEEDIENEEYTVLDEARDNYISNVIDNDKYITVINDLKSNYFDDNNQENVSLLLETIDELNQYWNTFRNITYDAYYENDYTLRPDINYEEYANDEYLLRLYTNAYYDMYEYLVNEFVMTYEYANNTASDLYDIIESEMQILGRPNKKLIILVALYQAIQEQGGAEAVLNAIAIRDAELANCGPEIEATLMPSQTITEVSIEENIEYDDGSSLYRSETTTITENYPSENEEDMYTEDDLLVYEEEGEDYIDDGELYADETSENIVPEELVATPQPSEEVVIEDNMATPDEEIVYEEEYIEYDENGMPIEEEMLEEEYADEEMDDGIYNEDDYYYEDDGEGGDIEYTATQEVYYEETI